jgi:hypothetical protein
MKRSIPSRTLWRGLFLATIFSILSAGSALANGPTISISVSPNRITNEGEQAVFTFTLSSPATHKIAVNLITGGSALNGSDYVLFGATNHSGQLVIPREATSATLTMHTFPEDIEPGPIEFATLRILGGSKYRVGSPSQATVTIDNLR